MNQLESDANLARLRQPDRAPSRRRAHGDRPARRRRVRSPVQPDHRRQRGLAVPALRRTPRSAPSSSSRSAPMRPATIRAQQAHVLERWPHGSPWLFPGIAENPDGTKPYAHGSLSHQLGNWQKAIDVRDETGQPVRVHAHQFRHTVGTRLINAGVPQHVIQKLLGPRQPPHDRPLRPDPRPHRPRRLRALLRRAGQHRRRAPRLRTRRAHRRRRVGQAQPRPRPRQPPQRLLRAPTPTGLPAPQRLPHLPRLPDHPRVPRHPPPARPTTNRKLIARADANGQFRLAENLRQVQDQPRTDHPRPRSHPGRQAGDPRRQLPPPAPAQPHRRHDHAVRRARCRHRSARPSTASPSPSPPSPTPPASPAAGSTTKPTSATPSSDSAVTAQPDAGGPNFSTGQRRLAPTAPRRRRDEIARLRAENTVLREQLARRFGEERTRR